MDTALQQIFRSASVRLPEILLRIANTEDAQDWIHPEQTSHTANPDDILTDAADQGVRIWGGRAAILEVLETIRREAGKCRHCGCELTTDLVDVGVCQIPQGPPYCQACGRAEIDEYAELIDQLEDDPDAAIPF